MNGIDFVATVDWTYVSFWLRVLLTSSIIFGLFYGVSLIVRAVREDK